jgi:AcrR family transcriptional regulator
MAEAKLDTQVRRRQIAEAAMGLVADQGLRRLSMAAIARRVGIVPSGIYRHFPNKDALIAAVLDRIEERLLANVAAAREEHADPLDCLKDILSRHIRFIREGRAIPRIIFSDDMHAGHPDRRQRVLRIVKRYTDEIATIVRAAQTSHRIRPELDVQTITLMLLGIVVPAAILWHLTDGGFDVTHHAQRAWQMFTIAITNYADSPASHNCEP